MTEQEARKRIPGFSQGVRANAAQRDLKMMQPICPNSSAFEMTSDGRRVPRNRLANQNCQLAGKGWWVDCEARGHNPYFTTRVWYEPTDVMDETGLVTGTRKIKHEETVPNITAIAINRRINSGKGAVRKTEEGGFRRLSEFGFAEVCQFRACQEPVDPRFHSPAFGDYCSELHLALVAADQQGMALTQVTGMEGVHTDKAQQRRAEQLRQAVTFAK